MQKESQIMETETQLMEKRTMKKHGNKYQKFQNPYPSQLVLGRNMLTLFQRIHDNTHKSTRFLRFWDKSWAEETNEIVFTESNQPEATRPSPQHGKKGSWLNLLNYLARTGRCENIFAGKSIGMLICWSIVDAGWIVSNILS